MANVGYYEMDNGAGSAAQVNEITNAGDTAVNITVPDATQLASIDALYVFNSSNTSYGAEYTNNLADISAAVNDGMNLIIFDRYVADANTILPGGFSMSFTRDADAANDEVNLAAGAPASFTNGPGGTIDDSTFDGGGGSTHGYVDIASLPPGAVPLLTTGDSTHVVAFTFPVGLGTVFYSSIPLDYYSTTSSSAITPAEIDTLFANTMSVLCFAAGTLIATPEGERPVEALQLGQCVTLARGGAAQITLITASHYGPEELAGDPRRRPVCITTGALGAGLPRRDLRVSRQHRMLMRSPVVRRMFGVAEVLAPAVKLTGLPGIFVDERVSSISYYHLAVEGHELVLAEGAPSETLFSGAEALRALPRSARAELPHAQSAALMPKGAKLKQLITRHAKNRKPLLSDPAGLAQRVALLNSAR